MSFPYSEDLRQKAIAAVERGEGKTKVSRHAIEHQSKYPRPMAQTQTRGWELSSHHPLPAGMPSQNHRLGAVS